MPNITKIVSGGQTGVDRAALDFARDAGIDSGGWVPKGRFAEDGMISPKYCGLTETKSAEYSERTERNVVDSDATLIISAGKLTGGSLLTKSLAKRHSKPFLHIDLGASGSGTAADARDWLETIDCRVLNIAGPRASSDPGIYRSARSFLTSLFCRNE